MTKVRYFLFALFLVSILGCNSQSSNSNVIYLECFDKSTHVTWNIAINIVGLIVKENRKSGEALNYKGELEISDEYYRWNIDDVPHPQTPQADRTVGARVNRAVLTHQYNIEHHSGVYSDYTSWSSPNGCRIIDDIETPKI